MTPVTVPAVTVDQMIEVDRLMVDEYGIELMQMMEHAGTNLARLAMSRFLGRSSRGSTVVVLAGRGGNGGGALVAARHLSNHGCSVRVQLSRPIEAFTGVPRHQALILQKMGVPLVSGMPDSTAPDGTGSDGTVQTPTRNDPALTEGDLIIDGIVGYSLSGALRGVAGELVGWCNEQPAPVLSLDLPSGIDGRTGEGHGVAVQADATMTLALPKVGLGMPAAAPSVGELYLADIGVPPELYRAPSLGLAVVPLFAEEPIIALRPVANGRFRPA